MINVLNFRINYVIKDESWQKMGNKFRSVMCAKRVMYLGQIKNIVMLLKCKVACNNLSLHLTNWTRLFILKQVIQHLKLLW